MTYVFDPPGPAAVAVAGRAALFPVRRIFCVGRNYADHVREMGNDPKSEPPIFFTKPADAVVESGAVIPYPLLTSNLHHEVELVLAIGAPGVEIAAAHALDHVWGYAVGCDLTRRDRQSEAKNARAPWDVAKAFDRSAPLGAITPAAQSGAKSAGRIWLSVNGVTRQEADLASMIWSASEIIAAASRAWALQAGDLIFTGTPAGVGPLVSGDKICCGIEGLSPLAFSISA